MCLTRRVFRDCNTLVRMCGILISGLANRFSSFRSRTKISFHRPVSVREHRWNLVKRLLDHLWAILAVYFLKVIVKLDVDAGRFVGGCTKRLGKKAAFASKPVCIQRKKEKDKITVGWGSQRISVARDVHESWKKIKCMCVYSSDTAFAQRLLSLKLRRRARFPSVLQGHPWLTLPAFVKHALEQLQETLDYANCKETSTNYTPLFSTSNITASQRTKTYVKFPRRLQNPARFALSLSAVSGDFYWLTSHTWTRLSLRFSMSHADFPIKIAAKESSVPICFYLQLLGYLVSVMFLRAFRMILTGKIFFKKHP